jgi:hypothetical protein
MVMRMIGLAALAWMTLQPLPLHAADDPAAGDLRDLKVGIAAADLPRRGYVDLACGLDGRRLAVWTEFDACAPDPQGLRVVTFEYDDSLEPFAAVNDAFEGTKIAGHPVRLALLFAADGTVEALRAETIASRPYLKKKAYLLGIRVMGHYGREGWSCLDRPHRPGRSPVGGLYIDRHCEKRLADRTVLLDTRLYRDTGETGETFTSGTTFEVRRNAG